LMMPGLAVSQVSVLTLAPSLIKFTRFIIKKGDAN
jgi:hypothetical protein